MIQRIVKNIDPDGIDRRGFLGCLAWAGTGVLWTFNSGIASSQAFGRPRTAAKGEFSFVQISDSHIGFSRPANCDVIGTVERAVEKINALDRAPEFILHTGDVSLNAQADDFDTMDQVLSKARSSRPSTPPASTTSWDSTVGSIESAMGRIRSSAAGRASTIEGFIS